MVKVPTNNVVIDAKVPAQVDEMMLSIKSPHKSDLKNSTPTARKRSRSELTPSPDSHNVAKGAKRRALPWNLLGTARRRSMRNSSRESSDEKSKALPPIKENNNYFVSSPLKSDNNEDSNKSGSRASSPMQLTPVKPSKTIKSVHKSSHKLASRESSVERQPLRIAPIRGRTAGNLRKLISSDSDSGPGRHVRKSDRVRQLKPLTDDSDLDQTTPKKTSGSDNDSDKPLANIKRRGRSRKIIKHTESEESIKKKRPCEINTESNTACDSTPRNFALESRLASSDSNSKHKSSILIRKNYFTSPDKRKVKGDIEVNRMMNELKQTIGESKNTDPTYATPPTIAKRNRLRTSAFKGNDECCNNDNTESTARNEPSGSSGSVVEVVEQSESRRSFQDRMKKIVENQKELIRASKLAVEKETTKDRQSKLLEVHVKIKRVYDEKALEAAIEKNVPYKEILNAIRVSESSRKGKLNREANKRAEEQSDRYLAELRKLEYFRCGACGQQVTKHLWLEHFNSHGGIAWIDGYEPPIKLSEWNEALRRTNNNIKIYSIGFLRCPTCGQEKRSGLGHLSHLLLCGESTENIEKKKISCELCNEKYLPFNASAHRTKCSGYNRLPDPDDGDDESSETEEETSQEEFNSSGRLKRKAVKK